MSFGQKPTAWARTPGGAQNPQLNQNLLANQLGLAAGQPFGAMPAISLNSSINALVNQAAFSNMNSVLAQAAQQQQQQQRLLPQALPNQQQNRGGPTQSPPNSRNQRTFVGTVTKLMETYGFVDEDVFFQTNVIRGAMPRVGDRVMVEASFNPSMPFKWNAYRIQLPQGQQDTAPPVAQQPQHNIRPPSAVHHPPAQHSFGPNNNSNVQHVQQRWQNDRRDDIIQRHQHDNRPHQHRQRNEVRRSPPRRSPVRSKQDSLKREREKSPIRSSREPARTRSPALSVTASSKRDADSPPRRRQRIVPRYRSYKPKVLPPSGLVLYQELHKRYSNLYIPSDFIKCEFSWLKAIQLNAPITFSPRNISYTIMHKDVDNPIAMDSVLSVENPPDVDNRFFVKVLLLSHPGLVALRQKMYGLLPDGSIDETNETQSIVKNLQFLVGVKNKNEYTCLGGAWSPSLDGESPLDPQTLINTAIRTTRNLVGIDLSACPKWYKMVHLHYYRAERNRIDSVVLMLPDTTSTAFLMPTEEEFKELEGKLKSQLADKLAAIEFEQFVSAASPSPNSATTTSAVAGAGAEKNSAGAGDGAATENSADTGTTAAVVTANSGSEACQPPVNPAAAGSVGEVNAEEAVNTSTDATTPSEAQQADDSATSANIKNMKVVELREELEKRGLDSKGVKNVLLQRLQEALDKEKSGGDAPDSIPKTVSVGKAMEVNIKKEIVEPMETDENDDAVKAAAEKAESERLEKEKKALEKAKEKFEKEKKNRKAALQRHFVLPKEPTVFVYPNKIAKGGKFDCKLMSMDSLLDYNVEACKESAFEVFVFAEALREALDRGNAFAVYQALENAEDRTVERERRDKALSEAINDISDEIIIIEEEGIEKKKKKDDKKDPRASFKALVYNADTFSAFAYFDENGTSYIEDRDLEDLLYSTGINISRGEAQKLIKKLSNRDRCNYRNITDKWVDSDGNAKYFSTPSENCKSAQQLIAGHDAEDTTTVAERVSLGTTPDVTDTGVVFYKGSVLNITKTMEQHQIVEKERTAAVVKNDELDMQLKSVKKQRDQFEKSKKRLEGDVDRYKKKLYEAEKCLKAAQEGSAIFKSALSDCKKYATRIQTIVDKSMPKKEEKKKSEEAEDNTKAALENGDIEIVLTEEVGTDDPAEPVKSAGDSISDDKAAFEESEKATQEADKTESEETAKLDEVKKAENESGAVQTTTNGNVPSKENAGGNDCRETAAMETSEN